MTAIVLAAGAGRRFGGSKLVARLDGKPILQHVLDALSEAGIDDPIVVLGADSAAVESAIAWRSARRVANPASRTGLASSLRVGWAAAMASEPRPRSVLVALADQPQIRPAVIAALLAEPLDPARPILVARHPDGAPNPVRLEPEADHLVASTSGDRGLGPLIDAHPEFVREIEVPAPQPDVDTRSDLVDLVLASWARRVRENHEQVDRRREVADGSDFYVSVSRTFVADPAREGDPVLTALLEFARPDDRWLDVGAGAGRYALPLARRVREVIAVDPSPSMLDALREGMRKHGLPNIRTVPGRWPPDDSMRAVLGPDPVADVALIAHVGYDIEAIGPFVDALESAARRRCVAILMQEAPSYSAAPFWPIVHGEERVLLPALAAFVELLEARGSAPTVRLVEAERRAWTDREELMANLRRQLWTEPGSERDTRLVMAVEERIEPLAGGGIGLRGIPTLPIGIVAWEPSISSAEGDRR